MLLGGSWVVISRDISRITIHITYIRGLITPLITTPKPDKSYRTLTGTHKGTLKETPLTPLITTWRIMGLSK